MRLFKTISIAGEEKEALNDCKKELKISEKLPLSPSNQSLAFSNLCAAKLNLGKFKDAINDCNKSIDIELDDFLPYFNRGAARIEIGELKGACEDWEKASELGDEDAIQ